MESARKPNPRGSLPRVSNVHPRTSILPNSRSQDPRNITDKSFQGAAIKKITEYLESHNFEIALTHKQLQTPTAKDFSRVLEFLVKQIDENYVLPGRLDVEVPELFRQLGYPFQITKNALVAIGAPNTWPNLLAALDWLVDLLVFSHNQLVQPPLDEESDEQSLIAEQMLKAYGLFLNHQDFSEDLQELKNQLKAKVDALALQTANMRQALAATKAEKEALKKCLVNPKTLDSHIARLEQEVRMLTNVDALIQKKKTLENRLAFLRDEYDVAQAHFRELELAIAATKEKIDHQEFTQEGLQRMEKEKLAIESQVELVRKDKEEAAQVVWNLEQKMKEGFTALSVAIRDFNLMCAEFKLIPSTAKHAIGIDFTLGCNENQRNEEEIVTNAACLSRLPEVVKAMRTKIDVKTEAKIKQLSVMEQSVHEKQQLCIELESQEKSLQASVQQVSSSGTVGIAAILEQIEKRNHDISEIDQEIKRMKDAQLTLSAQNSELLDTQDSLQMKLEHQLAEWNKQVADCLALVKQDTEAIINHKLEAADLMSELVAFSRARLD